MATSENQKTGTTDDTGGVVLADLFELPDRKQITASPDALTTIVRATSSKVATAQAELFAWLDAVDREGVWQSWEGIRSLSHWIGFVCELSTHTAREYARTMRGLRLMPEVAELFYTGRLSYSKVRAVTRIAGRVDAAEAAQFALVTKASQLEATVSSWVRLDDANQQADAHETEPWREAMDLNDDERDLDWLTVRTRGGGRARITLDLDEADAANVMAIVQGRRDSLVRAHRDNLAARVPATDRPDKANGVPTMVDAFLDLVHSADGTDVSASGDAVDVRSESTMVVHVSTDVLEEACQQTTADSVSAETPHAREQIGYVDGYGPVGTAAVGRLACNSGIVGAVVDAHGDVLALGRTKRLASRRQRLALRVRDMCCQFPGCHRSTGIEVHHIRAWAEGGATDTANMIQLCRAHHVTVHARAIVIERTSRPFTGAAAGTGMSAAAAGPGFRFFTSNGHEIVIDPRWTDGHLYVVGCESDKGDSGTGISGNGQAAAGVSAETPARVTDPVALDIAEHHTMPPVCEGPNRIETIGGGQGFTLEWCVWALFEMKRTLQRRQILRQRQETHVQAAPLA